MLIAGSIHGMAPPRLAGCFELLPEVSQTPLECMTCYFDGQALTKGGCSFLHLGPYEKSCYIDLSGIYGYDIL